MSGPPRGIVRQRVIAVRVAVEKAVRRALTSAARRVDSRVAAIEFVGRTRPLTRRWTTSQAEALEWRSEVTAAYL